MKIKEQITQEIIHHLRLLGNEDVEPINPSQGICSEVFNQFGIFIFDLWGWDELVAQWPKFTGCVTYPVPGGRGLCDKWGDNLEGNDRREFCLWLADKFEEML